MSILLVALRARLVGDSTLINDLSVYRGQSSVFTRWPAPEDAQMPYIVIPGGDAADAAFDSKTKIGRDSVIDIHCYAEATGSVILIERIAERVRARLHRHKLAITNYATTLTAASGPLVNDADGVYGRVISYRVMAVQT